MIEPRQSIINQDRWTVENGSAIMKKSALLLSAIFFIVVSAAYAQSLADLADKEKIRREEVKGEAKVIIIRSTAPDTESPAAEPQPDPAAKSEPEKKEAAPATNKTDPDEEVDLQGRPESYWRKTMAEARQKVKDLEEESKVLALKMGGLQTKFYNMDDGFARESVQRDIQKAVYEQDTNKANLEKAKTALQDLEKEARQSGALPGWLGH
jgi:hypothetical protein